MRAGESSRVEPHFGLDNPPAKLARKAEIQAAFEGPAPQVHRPKRSGNFIADHWRGLYSLGVSYWLIGLLVGVIAAFGTAFAQQSAAGDDGYQPVRLFLVLSGACVLTSVLAIWRLVGLWRSANWMIKERKSLGKRAPWAGIAKLMVILGGLQVLGTSAASIPQLQELYSMGFRDDPSIPPYSFRIMRNGTEVEVIGGFKYGLTEDFQKLLRASPQISVIHFDSFGGRVGEAEKLNAVIRAASLKTYVSDVCESACTLAYAGGVERWIATDGKLGFHQPAFPGLEGAELASAVADQSRLLIRSGFDANFVSKALAVPNTKMLTPSMQELQSAHVVTGVSDGTQFAASGYGADITAAKLSDPLARNVPIFGALKQYIPSDFSDVVKAYHQAYVDGQTQEELNIVARAFAFVEARKYLPSASDTAVVEYGELLFKELTILRSRNVNECAIMGSRAGSDPDILYSFGSDVIGQFQAVGVDVVRSAGSTSVPTDAQAGPLVSRVVADVVPTLTQKQVSALYVAKPDSSIASDYCTAIIAFYRQVLNSQPNEAAIILRSFVRSS